MYFFSEPGFSPGVFDQPISEQVWRSKYQYKTALRDIDLTVFDTWTRVAEGLAIAEPIDERDFVSKQFFEAMSSFKLLPGGRILSGAGTNRKVSLSNTFVMRTIPDSLEGILDVVKEAALTMKMGGGIGFDFSTLRPTGADVRGLDCPAAGPLAVMDICDSVCRMLVSGTGRGAMMATMRIDHPNIEEFVKAKSDPARMRNFNLSVLVSDEFMQAVENDSDWFLVWENKKTRQLKARDLWQLIMRQNYNSAEPGVLFIDRINRVNPLGYLEKISSTNSCAEQPLPPNGTCPLASINLAKLIDRPFTENARFLVEEYCKLGETAVRMLDNALDISKFATEAQRREARSKRRIGVGITGVADALIMLGIKYGSEASMRLVEEWMRLLQNTAYRASAELSASRGPFPLFDQELHCQNRSILSLDGDVRKKIDQYGLRNGMITTIAPTGTTSMFGGNVSSGIEPVFATSYLRTITTQNGNPTKQRIDDYAVSRFRALFGDAAPLTDAFVSVGDLQPSDHLRIQAAAQKWVDSGISKTVNCPEDIGFQEFQNIYRSAFEQGCKGCTTYRPNKITGSVLSEC